MKKLVKNLAFALLIIRRAWKGLSFPSAAAIRSFAVERARKI